MTTPKSNRSYMQFNLLIFKIKLAFNQQNKTKQNKKTKQKKNLIKKVHFAFMVAYFSSHIMCCIEWNWPRLFLTIYEMAQFRYHNTILKCFLKITGKPHHYRFYLRNFPKFCDNISHKLLKPSQFLEKNTEILEWYTLQK